MYANFPLSLFIADAVVCTKFAESSADVVQFVFSYILLHQHITYTWACVFCFFGEAHCGLCDNGKGCVAHFSLC